MNWIHKKYLSVFSWKKNSSLVKELFNCFPDFNYRYFSSRNFMFVMFLVVLRKKNNIVCEMSPVPNRKNVRI